MAEHPRNLRRHLQRWLHAYHIENEVRALVAGDFFDPLDGAIARDQYLVGAHLLGGLELGWRRVYRDDSRSTAQCFQYLNRHLAETAGANHDGGRSWPEQVDRALHGVITGERSIGERSRFTRVKRAQREEKPRGWNDHVVGHPAILSEAAGSDLPKVLTVVLYSHPAVRAAAAAQGP
jgi:hypothetical protein